MDKNHRRLLLLIPITMALAFLGFAATIQHAKSHPIGDMADMGTMKGMAMPPADTATGATIGGAFQLTDQDGKTVTDTDFAGRYRLMYFGYTSCPDICPLDLKKMTEALKLLDPAQAAKIAPIFISIDPERDTPKVLKSYVAAFSPRLTGLTGTVRQVQEVENGYKVYAAKTTSATSSDYQMNHSAYIYLMGPNGAFIDVTDPSDQKPAAIAAWLKAKLS
jgi:cytochrome oxidase Cu insertion factor (SCO1/SenC/PrrC family)